MVSTKSKPKQKSNKIASFLTIILLLLVNRGSSLATSSPESPVTWSTSYMESLAQAKAKNMPVLIKFEASWCVWCEKMEDEVYTDPEVAKELQKFICVKIDVDRQEDVAKAFKIRSLPRTIVLNTYNEIVGDWLGSYEASVFYKLLRDVDEYTHSQVGTTRAPDVQQAADLSDGREVLPEIDPNNTNGLIGLLGHKNAGVSRRVTELLIQLGPQVLPDVVPVLESSYLGTRIAAWKVVHDLTAGRYKFDPWAPTTERAKAAELIEERIQKSSK